jgi:hypothetical protein
LTAVDCAECGCGLWRETSSNALLRSGDEAVGVHAGADFRAGRWNWSGQHQHRHLHLLSFLQPAVCSRSSPLQLNDQAPRSPSLLGRDRLSAPDMEAPQPLPLGMTGAQILKKPLLPALRTPPGDRACEAGRWRILCVAAGRCCEACRRLASIPRKSWRSDTMTAGPVRNRDLDLGLGSREAFAVNVAFSQWKAYRMFHSHVQGWAAAVYVTSYLVPRHPKYIHTSWPRFLTGPCTRAVIDNIFTLYPALWTRKKESRPVPGGEHTN